MKYKMIVTDMDDTLLDKEHQLSKENKDAIIKAQEEGIRCVLASGRPTFAMRDYSEELQLAKYGSHYLSFNGAIITDAKDGSIWFKQCLAKEDAHTLYKFAQDNEVDIITYLGDDIISETMSEYIEVESDLTGMPVRMVDSFVDTIEEEVVKCILLGDPEYLKEVEQKLIYEHGDQFSIAISKPFFLEVMMKGVDKGASLKRLTNYLSIDLKDVIGVGDSYNDMTLLETAGCAISVENAKPELKAISQHIAPSSENHALKYIIEEIA